MTRPGGGGMLSPGAGARPPAARAVAPRGRRMGDQHTTDSAFVRLGGDVFAAVHELGRAISDRDDLLVRPGDTGADDMPGRTLSNFARIDGGKYADHVRRAEAATKRVVEFAAEKGYAIDFLSLILFDPDDPTGERFYTVLYAPCGPVMDRFSKFYRREMDKNLDYPSEFRGPLVPNPYLYLVPYVHYVHQDDAADPPAAGVAAEWNGWAGWFKKKSGLADGAAVKPIDERDKKAKAFARVFLTDMTMRLRADGFRPNLSAYIPLPRPATPVTAALPPSDASALTMLRGGALAVYGRLTPPPDEPAEDYRHQVIGELKDALTAEILRVSNLYIHTEQEKERAQRLTYAQFVHQTRNLVDEVWAYFHEVAGAGGAEGDEHLPALSCLWRLKCTTDLFSSRPLPTEERVTSNTQNTFPGWRRQAEANPSSVLADIYKWAAQHAVQRALVTPKTEEVESPSAAKVARCRAFDFLCKLDGGREVEWLLARLEDRCEWPNETPDWALSHGFVITLYHCLWQAIYHALIVLVDGADEPVADPLVLRLRFTTDGAGAEVAHIDNRAVSHDPPAKPTNDAEFYRLLEGRMAVKVGGASAALYQIVSPAPVLLDDGWWWRTTVRRLQPFPAGRRPV